MLEELNKLRSLILDIRLQEKKTRTPPGTAADEKRVVHYYSWGRIGRVRFLVLIWRLHLRWSVRFSDGFAGYSFAKKCIFMRTKLIKARSNKDVLFYLLYIKKLICLFWLMRLFAAHTQYEVWIWHGSEIQETRGLFEKRKRLQTRYLTLRMDPFHCYTKKTVRKRWPNSTLSLITMKPWRGFDECLKSYDSARSSQRRAFRDSLQSSWCATFGRKHSGNTLICELCKHILNVAMCFM